MVRDRYAHTPVESRYKYEMYMIYEVRAPGSVAPASPPHPHPHPTRPGSGAPRTLASGMQVVAFGTPHCIPPHPTPVSCRSYSSTSNIQFSHRSGRQTKKIAPEVFEYDRPRGRAPGTGVIPEGVRKPKAPPPPPGGRSTSTIPGGAGGGVAAGGEWGGLERTGAGDATPVPGRNLLTPRQVRKAGAGQPRPVHLQTGHRRNLVADLRHPDVGRVARGARGGFLGLAGRLGLAGILGSIGFRHVVWLPVQVAQPHATTQDSRLACATSEG
eukprot:scaffold1277_cov157-Isochrysis_galbana.AAC.3